MNRAYNDLDIFVCNYDDFEAVLSAFEQRLAEHGHLVETRLVKHFVSPIGDANVDTVVADGDTGAISRKNVKHRDCVYEISERTVFLFFLYHCGPAISLFLDWTIGQSRHEASCGLHTC